ncbi:hypothetical protein BGX29_000227 [Mortierella sp. GBA35]|nr:hypothetical protein BGX29_000227 [Mortierella sp. GBA35]
METEEQIITTETTTTQEEVVLEHVEKDDIVDKKVDIDADVEADAVDVEKVQVDAEPEVEIVDNEVKEVVEVDVEVAPSPSLPECKISGIPASLGDLTTESLSLGAMDLEEEPDILQFLVDRVHEDPDYTKLLLWTVYKSGAEGIVNQSTKNAMYILEMAGIHFQLQRTAMKSFLMGMIIIRLFAKSFYKVEMAFGMAMFGIFVLRRKATDVFDQSKPFETSDSWVLITPLGIPLVTTVTYITIFAFIMRLS